MFRSLEIMIHHHGRTFYRLITETDLEKADCKQDCDISMFRNEKKFFILKREF